MTLDAPIGKSFNRNMSRLEATAAPKRFFLRIFATVLATVGVVSAGTVTFRVQFAAPVRPEYRVWVMVVRDDSPDTFQLYQHYDRTHFEATYDFPEAKNYLLYRFALDVGQPATGPQMVPEDQPGRILFFTNDVAELPFVTYGDVASAVTNRVTFQVDMRALIEKGQFNPLNPSVSVLVQIVEGHEAWFYLNRIIRNGVFEGTVPVIGAQPGDTVKYRYSFPNIQYEDIATRSFSLAGGPQTLRIDYFGNLLPSGEAGPLRVDPKADSGLSLSWILAEGTTLQKTTDLGAGWVDIADSVGKSSYDADRSSDPTFFRLIRR